MSLLQVILSILAVVIWALFATVTLSISSLFRLKKRVATLEAKEQKRKRTDQLQKLRNRRKQ